MAKNTGTVAKKAAPKDAPKPKTENRNGISRPRGGTITGKIWDICDGLAKKTGTAERKDVLSACEKENINAATIATQHARWRKFNGLTKVAKREPAPAATGAPTTPPAPEAPPAK